MGQIRKEGDFIWSVLFYSHLPQCCFPNSYTDVFNLERSKKYFEHTALYDQIKNTVKIFTFIKSCYAKEVSKFGDLKVI